MTPNKPAHLIYTFAPKALWDDQTFDYFHALWNACVKPHSAGGFGMTTPVSAISACSEFPSEIKTQPYGFHVRAAVMAPPDPEEAAAYYVAIVFEHHDVFGMLVFLSPNREAEGLEGWQRLWGQWQNAMKDAWRPASILAETHLFYALYAGLVSPEMQTAVVQALPGESAPWRQTPICQSDHGISFWEGDPLEERGVLAMLAPPQQDEAVTEWAFWNTPAQLAVLPRCLLHAAKIDYEWGLYQEQMPRVRAQQQSIDNAVNDIMRRHTEPEREQKAAMEELIAAQERLSEKQADATGLIVSLSRLRELRQTIEIAEQNLRASLLLPASTAETKCTLFRQELARAEWLRKQIDHDIIYLQAVRERAQEVYSLTSLRLERIRLLATERAEKAAKEAAERQEALIQSQERAAKAAADQQEERAQKQERIAKDLEHKQHHMDLMQTVILGALLVSLDAMHAFHTEFPLSEELKWPLIALLMATVFVLPLLILHWHERYRLIDYCAGVLFGAAVAWFSTTYWWHDHFHHAPALHWVAIYGLVEAAGAALVIWILGQFQKKRESEQSDTK